MWRSALLLAGVVTLAMATAAPLEFDRPPGLAAAGFPLSEAVRVGDTLYVSGLLGTTGRDLAPGGIAGETRQAMENLGAVLRRHGLDFGSVVKCTIYLADIAEWAAFNAVYAKYFSTSFPARTAVGGVTLVRSARMEIDCIAAFGPNATNPSGRP